MPDFNPFVEKWLDFTHPLQWGAFSFYNVWEQEGGRLLRYAAGERKQEASPCDYRGGMLCDAIRVSASYSPA